MGEAIKLVGGLHFPEGPAFDRHGTLWAVELRAGRLVSWKGGTLSRYDVGGRPNGIAIDRFNRIVFADAEQNSIRRFTPDTEQCETLADQVEGLPLNAPNDLAFDPHGNLVFTCPGDSRQEPTGYVCLLKPDGAVRKIARDLYFPNGLAFSADGKSLYLAETYRQRVWKGEWSATTGAWLGEAVWCDQLQGAPGPDGMAFDAAGDLWIAVYGSGALFQVAPEGVIRAKHPLPGLNPTNCAFSPDGIGLVITEAEHGCLLILPEAGPGMQLF